MRKVHGELYLVLLVAAVSVIGMIIYSGSLTGQATQSVYRSGPLKLNDKSCISNIECSSGVCSANNVCISSSTSKFGSACRFLENKVGSGSRGGMFGNDRECTSGLCGVSSLSPIAMACEYPKKGKRGSPCGRNIECASSLCDRLPNEFTGTCR